MSDTTEFVTIKAIRIEFSDRAGLQVLLNLEMHEDVQGADQSPMFADLAFGYDGDPVGRVVAALFKTCEVSKLADLEGKPLVVEYDKSTRTGLVGSTIPKAVAFSSVNGRHHYDIKALVSGKTA